MLRPVARCYWLRELLPTLLVPSSSLFHLLKALAEPLRSLVGPARQEFLQELRAALEQLLEPLCKSVEEDLRLLVRPGEQAIWTLDRL